MSDQRPCKRPRREDVPSDVAVDCRAGPITATDALAKHGPVRDADIWFSTGNLIIVASGQVAFRVYRGLLAIKSEVFRGLFELPPPPGDHEKMDDCPVVQLSDSPEDLKPLLLVIYCRKNYFYCADEPIPVPFDTLAALVRMSHKYGIHDLYETALGRLRAYYPSDLRSWDDICRRQRYVLAQPSDALVLLKLAHLTETRTLLPTAYLICCSLDETRRVRPHTGEQTPLLAELSIWDHKRVLSGKARLAQMCATRVFHMLRPIPCETCIHPERCMATVHNALRQISLVKLEKATSDLYVLEPLINWFWEQGPGVRPCSHCSQAADAAHREMREQVWAKLPSVFGVVVEEWGKEVDAEETDVDVDEAEAEAEAEEE